jgi:hypothetical protein
MVTEDRHQESRHVLPIEPRRAPVATALGVED